MDKNLLGRAYAKLLKFGVGSSDPLLMDEIKLELEFPDNDSLSHAQEQSEPVAFDDYPEYNHEAMGCGLEDRGITDRYDAMHYGWEQAIERTSERIKGFVADLAPPQPAQEWISVKDRLPETRITNDKPCILEGRAIPPQINSDWVLVIHLKGETRIVGIDQLTGLDGRGVWWDNYRNNVTHWMPLPAAPKQEAGK